MGEVANAAIKIFKLVHDRIWAFHKGALKAYPTDNLRVAVSALAKLSLCIEMCAAQAGRSAAVLAVEAVRALLRFSLLVRSGFDLLVHGGEPDMLAVRLEPGDPPQAEDEPPGPPKVAIVGGESTDSSRVRSLWFRGHGTEEWYNMPPNHPGMSVRCVLCVFVFMSGVGA